jgi:hypothetical protein
MSTCTGDDCKTLKGMRMMGFTDERCPNCPALNPAPSPRDDAMDAARYRLLRKCRSIVLNRDLLSREVSLARSDGLGDSLDILIDHYLERKPAAPHQEDEKV